MRDYLKRLLSQGYEVEAVTDGIAALTAARQQLPDLVLADVMMPGLDGFGLLRELRTDPQTRELPIILLSARAGEEARVEGLKAGADDYLIKPFSARELLARVEANLKLQGLRQEAAQRERELRAAAQAAEARTESVLSSINDQFLVLDHEWRYTYVNDRVVEVVGLPREELLGKCIWDVYPDTVESQLYTEVHRAVAEQTIVRFEYFYPPWQRWFEIRVYPTANGVSLLITEITERKQAESALRESNARLSFALDSAQLGDWDLDLLTRTARRSLKHDQIFGYDSLLPHWSYEIFLEHVYPEDRKFVGQKFQRTLVTHQDWDFECRILRSDQSIRWIWAQGSVYHDTHGTPIRILGIVTDITERKRTEEELLSSKHQLRLVTDNVPVFIAYYDTEGRYRFINRRYAECFGLKPEEAIGKHIPEVVGEEAYRSIREYIDTALSGQTISFEAEVPFETIGAHWMRIGYVPDFNERAEVRGLFAVISDISDRKRAEIALQNSEAKFRAVFEQMYQFMGLLTPDGILVEVNQNPLRFANVERSAVIGLPLWEFPSLKATAELKKIAKTAVAQAASGQFIQGKVTIPDANNKPHTFDVSVKPIYATEIHPQVVFLIVEARDISTQVHLQDALRQEQERSLQLINSSVDGIVAFDANGCCTLWNPAMKQLTGIQQEEVMGKSGMDVFSAFLDAKTMQSFAFGTAETATALDLHFIHLKTGQRQWVEARYSPLHDGDDTPHGGLMMVRDVTKQRELEWMKREFISIISHEIRTPLSSIRGSLGLVASGLLDDDPETAKEMLGIANNNIERLVRLVNDILALNRLESGQVKLKKQWCDEAALVQQAFSNVQNLAHSNQITLQSSVPGIQIWADPDWLVQVLVNLINNAVKFSPAGTTVSVSTQTQTQQVFFQVKDQGRGIPTEKLETIFEQFQQVDTSDSRQKGGTGLGLAICRLIVQLHDGRIWAESELNQGSTFCFTLPIPQRSHL